MRHYRRLPLLTLGKVQRSNPSWLNLSGPCALRPQPSLTYSAVPPSTPRIPVCYHPWIPQHLAIPQRGRTPVDWDVIWSHLFDFLEQLLRDSQIWRVDGSDERYGRPSFISNAAANLLNYGTRGDPHGYPDSLLVRCWPLIQTLVQHGDTVSEPNHDPLNQAINSTKGRAIEASILHILRRWRLADNGTGSHAEIWRVARGFLDRELALCVDGNFEFSSLCGLYLRNLEHIGRRWLHDNIRSIFPRAYPRNLACALGGLAYAATTRSTYRLLRDSGVIENAVRLESMGRYSREKLMQNIIVGYVWGEETLCSGPFGYLSESESAEDLQLINRFLRSIRHDALDPKQIDRILGYWRWCVEWHRGNDTHPAQFWRA